MAAAAQVVAARTLPMWRDWVSDAGSHAAHAGGGPTLRANRHGSPCARDGGRRSAQRSLLPATAHLPLPLGHIRLHPSSGPSQIALFQHATPQMAGDMPHAQLASERGTGKRG